MIILSVKGFYVVIHVARGNQMSFRLDASFRDHMMKCVRQKRHDYIGGTDNILQGVGALDNVEKDGLDTGVPVR